MGLLNVILFLILSGLWILNPYVVTVSPANKKIINWIVAILLVVWLLLSLGILGGRRLVLE